MLRNDSEYRKELVLQQKAGGTAGVKKPCESRKQWDLGAKVEELVYSWFAGDLPALGTEGPAPTEPLMKQTISGLFRWPSPWQAAAHLSHTFSNVTSSMFL